MCQGLGCALAGGEPAAGMGGWRGYRVGRAGGVLARGWGRRGALREGQQDDAGRGGHDDAGVEQREVHAGDE